MDFCLCYDVNLDCDMDFCLHCVFGTSLHMDPQHSVISDVLHSLSDRCVSFFMKILSLFDMVSHLPIHNSYTAGWAYCLYLMT